MQHPRGRRCRGRAAAPSPRSPGPADAAARGTALQVWAKRGGEGCGKAGVGEGVRWRHRGGGGREILPSHGRSSSCWVRDQQRHFQTGALLGETFLRVNATPRLNRGHPAGAHTSHSPGGILNLGGGGGGGLEPQQCCWQPPWLPVTPHRGWAPSRCPQPFPLRRVTGMVSPRTHCHRPPGKRERMNSFAGLNSAELLLKIAKEQLRGKRRGFFFFFFFFTLFS